MSNFPSGTVTFLFTDIEDSTKLWQEQPEAMAQAHAFHDKILHEAIEANHGYVFQVVGDSFSVAFHNAIDGLNAALTAQRGLESKQADAALKIKARMGLHTGTATIQADGKYDGYVTIASTQRVMSVAYGGQTLLSQATVDLIQSLPGDVLMMDMGEHQLKSLREPLRLYQLNSSDLPKNFPPIQSLNSHPNNLPTQLTSFVGREKQLDDITGLIADSRMVTLIGPGGTGKTRLSVQLAEHQLFNFQDGGWFIELAPLTDATYIISTIASTFNVREVQGIPLLSVLMDYLRSKQLLLILDNCEHLVEACAQLTDQLLHECPRLKILASSREALGISGETVYRVPSMKDNESTRLFIERATKSDSRFQATDENAPFIAQICSRLDGIPLAIELAASRVKLFSPQQIAERLDDRFKLLTGGSRTALPRQQTLRALIDWSYQTLNETEQLTLRRLAVFAGGWTFEAAEAVVGESEVFDGLAGLVNKSLVNVDEQLGSTRYRFLETIRQYAMEKLVETGESNESRNRQLDYMLQFIDQIKPQNFGIDSQWLDQIDSEHDNLRVALEWGIANDIGKAIELARNVSWYWSTRDFISEALFWYKTILTKSESLPDSDSERAQIYFLLGWNSILIGNHREGRAAAEIAVKLAKQVNQVRTVVFASCALGLACSFLGDLATAETVVNEAEKSAREAQLKEELSFVTSARAQMIYYTSRDAAKAKAYLDEAIQLSMEVGYRWETAFLIFGQARLAGMLGDVETARARFEKAAEIAQHMGNKRMIFANRSELAHVLRANGQIDEAYAIYRAVIPGWKDLGHRAAVAHELECIAYILTHREELERAVTLLSGAQAIRKAINLPRTKIEDDEYEQEVLKMRRLLGEANFERNWTEGENLSMDEAIELALG